MKFVIYLCLHVPGKTQSGFISQFFRACYQGAAFMKPVSAFIMDGSTITTYSAG